jgi:hypothetical protein
MFLLKSLKHLRESCSRTTFKGISRIFPIALILSVNCVERYDPPIDQQSLNILVVDGFINATANTAEVKLSRTQSIHSLESAPTEANAVVSIESSTGGVFALKETEPGTYRADPIMIDKNAFYSLRIQTYLGVLYRSDTIRIRDTPPIDSLSFGISNNGNDVTIHVNTHDASAKTRYYAWDYSETYEYNAPFVSGFTFVNRTPMLRRPEQRIDKCWRTLPATRVSIGTTNRLSEDILSGHVLTTIDKSSPKISVRYSILVRQRAISASEHEYLRLLIKNESLGTLFDTPPVSVIGNVHQADDASVPVLGYFTGSTVEEKRFFVDHTELPQQLRVPASRGPCQLELSCHISCPSPVSGPESCICLRDLTESTVLIGGYSDATGNIASYSFVSAPCGDCRVQGGTTQKPDFW